tara:strand:+ start:981 stop:1856 length:876 start_codon:yes stop_codon:yes gene_type:complete
MAINEYQSERHLEDKSKLVFHFNMDTEPKYETRTLHFMENIEIDEKVVANYSQYTPIGSNGETFAYLGTKSREFNISFNMTLPHIMESTLIRPEVTNPNPSKALLQSMFFGFSYSKGLEDHSTKSPLRSMKSFIKHVDDQHTKLLSAEDRATNNEGTNIINGIGTKRKLNDVREVALTKVMHWVNLIRASCLTNTKKPYLGPPIVKLHHGILYSNIPCIVTSYNITYDQMHGFDAKTMLPRVISVKLNLKEVRLRGKEFSPGKPQGEYMPGWNSFIHEDFVTLDPTIPKWS